eukprot:COSAG03_NODE_5264_length_1294_cov_1.573222_2_plen_44_part_00
MIARLSQANDCSSSSSRQRAILGKEGDHSLPVSCMDTLATDYD